MYFEHCIRQKIKNRFEDLLSMKIFHIKTIQHLLLIRIDSLSCYHFQPNDALRLVFWVTNCRYSTMVSASACRAEDVSSILITCSNRINMKY